MKDILEKESRDAAKTAAAAAGATATTSDDLPALKISTEALHCLQWASEGFLSELFSDMALVAGHAKRKGITQKDLELVARLRRLVVGAQKH